MTSAASTNPSNGPTTTSSNNRYDSGAATNDDTSTTQQAPQRAPFHDRRVEAAGIDLPVDDAHRAELREERGRQHAGGARHAARPRELPVVHEHAQAHRPPRSGLGKKERLKGVGHAALGNGVPTATWIKVMSKAEAYFSLILPSMLRHQTGATVSLNVVTAAPT